MPFDGSLLDIKRRPLSEVIDPLRARDTSASKSAGHALLRDAQRSGVSVKDYLMLAIQPDDKKFPGLNGYEMALAELNLPIRNDFKEGIVLQAASETFQTFPGTRAMFAPVIDDMLRWAYMQDQFENVANFLAVSRTVNGPELIYTTVDDTSEAYATNTVPEGSRVPIRSIRTSEAAVRFWKHGSGFRTTYEFNRRASLDVLTPFAARVARELMISKAKTAVTMLVGGDGTANSAAAVIDQSSYNGVVGTNSTNGRISYTHLLAWLVARAKAGFPIDTVVGNWDAYFQWLLLFQPTITANLSQQQAAQQMAGVSLNAPRILPGPVNFALCSSAPANKLVGLIKAETLEELREAGGDISEQAQNIENQTVNYIRTENTGYRLVMKDTRSIFNFGG